MPTEVLTQLRAMRESIAESLRTDPRYLTLMAIDKSIAEITGVLSASGLMTDEPAAHAPLHFETSAPSTSPYAAAEPSPRNLSAAAAPRFVEPMHPPKEQSDTEAAAALVAESVAAEIFQFSEARSRQPSQAEPLHAEPMHPELLHPEPSHPDAEAAPPEADPHAAIAEQEHAGEAPLDDVAPGGSSGYIPMQAREGATQFQPGLSVRYGRLPAKVDLRPSMSPVESQGDTSSCVASAVASAHEYAVRKATKHDHDVSRLFVYYNARWRDGAEALDDGSAIQLAMEGVCSFGACGEAAWPFDQSRVFDRPNDEAYREAQAWRAQGVAQVPLKLDAWKQALAEGKPIVFGITLFDSFETCSDRGGVVEMPLPQEIAGADHGVHAMCAVGYSDKEKVFIVRNCWGSHWGDHGYCYMPFAYVLNPKFNDGDAWVLVAKTAMQPPREAWSDDTTPVTNNGAGVDFAIEPHRVEDYAGVAFAPFDPIRRPFNATAGDDFARYAAEMSSHDTPKPGAPLEHEPG